MDDNDFDQTQAIYLDDYDQETEEDADKANTPVAYLKVSCQSGFLGETFPLIEGDNVIGRHKESCNVCIPLKALSREHACIEIRGDSHLIYDKNSRNKTKRNKLYLNPDVRYELKNGDTLMFGDVTSKYTIVNKDNDVGSETGSESEYQTANDLDIISKKDETMEIDELEYDSDNSVDLLQPTQAYTNNSTRNTTGKLLLAEDSIDERDINKTTVLVGETPAPSRQKVASEAFVEESGSETEDEADVGKDVPQTLVVEESQEDESDNEHMLYVQTQAYTGEDEGDLTDEGESKTIFTEATQAFPDVLHKQEKSDAPPQTFVEESDTEDEEAKKSAFQYAATQAYLDDVEDVDNEATQATEEEGEAVVETDEEDVSHLFAESTLACDIDDFTDEDGRQIVDQEGETQMVLDEPTQAVSGDNENETTQVVPGDEPTRVCPVVNEVRKTVGRKQKPVTFEDATVAVVEDATVAVVEDPTVAVVEDATVAVVEDATVAVAEDPTVAVMEDATVAVQEDATVVVQEDATMAVQEGATVAVQEDATVAVQEDATMAMQEDATVAVQEDATVAVQEDATMAMQEDATMAVQEGATVAVQEDATVAVQEDATMAVQEDDTVAVLEDTTMAMQEDTNIAVQEDSTLIAITNPERSKGKGGIKNSGTQESTKKLQDEVAEIATKGKGKVSVKKKLEKDPGNTEVSGIQESEEGSIRKSSRSKRKSLKMVEMENSLDDLVGIDRSIKSGEDYSPESSETDSPRKITKTETRGRKPKVSAKSKSSKEAEVVVLPKNVPPLPKEVVKQTETEFLMTLPALQDKDLAPPVQIEATQVYAMDTDEELPKCEILEATQPYVMNEDDSTPPLEEEAKEEGDVTPPIEDVMAALSPYGLVGEAVGDSEEAKYPLISIPSRSPLKPTLVSPEKRKKSPSPKRVQFTVKKIDSTSTNASEKDVETDDSKPSTSKVSKSTIKSTPAVTRVTRGKQTTVVESKKLHVDDNERTGRTVRGKKSVTVESAPVPSEKQETKTSRGRRSVASKTEKQVPETSEITTKTRGRKSIASKKETQKVVEVKENKINKADEEGGIEADMLISDSEKDNENDRVVEKPTRKGRSRTSMSGQSNMQIENSDKKKEVKEAETSTKSTILQQKKNLKNTPGGDSEKEQSKSSPETTVDHNTEEKVSEKTRGRKSRHIVSEKTEDSGPLTSANRRVGRKLDTDNSDTLNTTGSKNMSVVKSESRTDVEGLTENDTIKTSKSDTKQRGRRGRSSILSVNEQVETADKDMKYTSQTGRRGRSAVVESESKDDSKTESKEISESETKTKTKLSGKRGRASALERNSSNDSVKSESDETGNKTVKRRGQRSSSQSPSKIAEEKPIARGRRGRSVIQTATTDEDKDSMPPPSNIGHRGKKDKDIIHDDTTASNTQDNKRNSRQLRDNVTVVDSKKGGKNNKKDKSLNLDVSLEDISEKDKSDSSLIDGRERSSSRNRNKELVKVETDTKPVRGKRKKESLVDQSKNLPSTSKQSKIENTIDHNVIITKRGRSSDVKNKTEIKVDVIETKKNKIQTKKRGRTDDEDSPDTPGKKTKLNELQTPQPKKTLAVGSPSLRRKSMEPTKPKVLFTGVIDEPGQKVIKDLGGEVVNNVNDCTHLVTDKVRRTVKFLCCLARGIPIITLQWIESCRQSAMFVDGSKFQVKDTATEKQYKFSLQRSLEKAKEACLFQGYKIHVTKNVKPEPTQMKEIIECAGGRFLSTMPKKSEDKLVIVSCPEDKLLCSHASMTGVPVVNPEFILTGILRQEISIKSYALFTDKTDNPGKTASHRKK